LPVSLPVIDQSGTVDASGILLAFGLNSWNEGRKQRIVEIKVAGKKDLIADSVGLAE